jgi:hypothetical protein
LNLSEGEFTSKKFKEQENMQIFSDEIKTMYIIAKRFTGGIE